MLVRRLATTARLGRSFSTNAVKASAAATNAPADSKEPLAAQYFRFLKVNNRDGNRLRTGRLWHLLDLISDKDQLIYALKGIKYYQANGLDFSTDVAAKFVQTCLKFDYPRPAGRIFAKYLYRISAWVPSADLEMLVKKLVEQNDVDIAAQVLNTVSLKGVKATPATFESVLSAIGSLENSATVHSDLLSSASRMLSKEQHSSIIAQFPLPTAN